jgi:hypothetical protein
VILPSSREVLPPPVYVIHDPKYDRCLHIWLNSTRLDYAEKLYTTHSKKEGVYTCNVGVVG